MTELDSPDREDFLHKRIHRKKGLLKLYQEYYLLYADCINICPEDGINLEIGSGAGFVNETLPDVVTSDLLPYSSVKIVINAMHMPFASHSLASVFMLNTLHHIPNVYLFFHEIDRCLKPGGRLLIVDQFSGLISDRIYTYLHHEPYDKETESWQFKTTGPLSGANGALCWIIFYRDLKQFKQLYPKLKVIKSAPHSPLRYWLAGGLKSWSFLPGFMFNFWTRIDNWLADKFPALCSFTVIEIEKI